MLPEKAGIAPFLQITFGAMAFFYYINYAKFSKYGLLV